MFRIRTLACAPLLLTAIGLVLAGCGSASPVAQDKTPQPATLVLDFTPNAVHTGIYAALAHHYDLAEGVHLHVIAPSASTDSVKYLEAGRADFAILDIHDLAIARERGQDIVGIMAIVERPLAAVIAQHQIHSPRQLEGRLTGVTGAPSDTAVLDSIVAGAGGSPQRLRTLTIGYNAVPDLLAGRVSAATAFWNDEGVTLERARPGFHIFRVENYGAPPYPELVLCATENTLIHHGKLAFGVVRALVRGYRFAVAHPAAAAAELERQVPGLNSGLVSAELTKLVPAFTTPGGAVGELELPVLKRWARWEARFGIVETVPNISRAFNLDFLGGSG